MPGKLNGILRLHFCKWTDADTAWMTREALEPCLAEFDPAIHHGKKIVEGVDLSQNRDLTVKASIVETGSMDVEVVVEGKRSEEHTSELQSLMRNSYAVLCLKNKKRNSTTNSKQLC